LPNASDNTARITYACYPKRHFQDASVITAALHVQLQRSAVYTSNGSAESWLEVKVAVSEDM